MKIDSVIEQVFKKVIKDKGVIDGSVLAWQIKFSNNSHMYIHIS
jgi:hypothetical protein